MFRFLLFTTFAFVTFGSLNDQHAQLKQTNRALLKTLRALSESSVSSGNWGINGLTNQNQQLRRTNKAEELVGAKVGLGNLYGPLLGEMSDSSFCATSTDCAEEGLDRSLGETPDHFCQPLTEGDLENFGTVFHVEMRLSPEKVRLMYGFDSTTVGLCMPIIEELVGAKFGNFYEPLLGEMSGKRGFSAKSTDSSFCATSTDCAEEGLDRSLGETPDHFCKLLTEGDLENFGTVFYVEMRLSPEKVRLMYGFDSTTVGLCMPIIARQHD